MSNRELETIIGIQRARRGCDGGELMRHHPVLVSDARYAPFEDGPVINSTAEMFFNACGGHAPLRLAIFGENHETDHISFERPYLLIGRSPECDLQLNDPDVSFRHAYLQIVDGRVLCVDLASRTGIIFRTGPKPMQWLDIEDPVQIGSHVIQLQRSDVLETPTHSSSIIISGTPSDDDRKKLPKVSFELLNRPGMGIVSRQKYWPVRHQVSLIGWSPACKLQLKDGSVSRVHASVVLTQTGLWVVDLLGKGGTRVNDEAVNCAHLVDGDQLQIGRFRMEIHFDVSLSARALVHQTELGAIDSPRSLNQPIDENRVETTSSQPDTAKSRRDEKIREKTRPIDTEVDHAPPAEQIPRDHKSTVAARDEKSPPQDERRDLIRTSRREAPLKTQRELARQPRDGSNSKPRELSTDGGKRKKDSSRGLSERFVTDVMDRFVQMQQQTLDHNMQMMMMVTQMFASMHQRQQDTIQGELARVREIDKELQTLRAAILARSNGEQSAAIPETEAPERTPKPHGPAAESVAETTTATTTTHDQNRDETDVVGSAKAAAAVAPEAEERVAVEAQTPVDEISPADDDTPSLDDDVEISFDESEIPVEPVSAGFDLYNDHVEMLETPPESEDLLFDDSEFRLAVDEKGDEESDELDRDGVTADEQIDQSRDHPVDSKHARRQKRKKLEEEEYPDEVELERRLRMLEHERTSRWQKIMNFISGSIPMS